MEKNNTEIKMVVRDAPDVFQSQLFGLGINLLSNVLGEGINIDNRDGDIGGITPPDEYFEKRKKIKDQIDRDILEASKLPGKVEFETGLNGVYAKIDFLSQQIKPTWVKTLVRQLLTLTNKRMLSIRKVIPDFFIAYSDSDVVAQAGADAKNIVVYDNETKLPKGIAVTIANPRPNGNWEEEISVSELIQLIKSIFAGFDNETEGVNMIEQAFEFVKNLSGELDLNALEYYEQSVVSTISKLYSTPIYQKTTWAITNIQNGLIQNEALSSLVNAPSKPLRANILLKASRENINLIYENKPNKLAKEINKMMRMVDSFYDNENPPLSVLSRLELNLICQAAQNRLQLLFGDIADKMKFEVVRMRGGGKNIVNIVCLPRNVQVNEEMNEEEIKRILNAFDSDLESYILENYGETRPEMKFVNIKNDLTREIKGKVGTDFVGTSNDDRINVKGRGFSTINSGAGDDVLTGLKNSQIVVGGEGDDIINADLRPGQLSFYYLGSRKSGGLGDDVLNLKLTNKGNAHGVGKAEAVVIPGNGQAEVNLYLPKGYRILNTGINNKPLLPFGLEGIKSTEFNIAIGVAGEDITRRYGIIIADVDNFRGGINIISDFGSKKVNL